MKDNLSQSVTFLKEHQIHLSTITLFVILLFTLGYLLYLNFQKTPELRREILALNDQISNLTVELASKSAELDGFLSEDQVVVNKKLNEEIDSINKTYKRAVSLYEDILDLKDKNIKDQKLDDLYAKALTQLAQEDYSGASATLDELEKKIAEQSSKLATTFKIPENVPVQTAPPSSGYRKQQVQTDTGVFLVDIISADIGSTRVIVDTASEGDCSDNCPALSLAEYVARNGAFAGVNGSYFCPAAYPSCAGKTNSFDTLLMNKDKKYFNSGNNVYSTIPAVIFGGSYIRFVGQSLEWGRDSGIDRMIANYPLLTLNGQIMAYGGDDPKLVSKGGRSFVGSKGNTVYIGVVHSATIAESAKVINTLGIENALNLDDGGSTALWSGGYKAGPGRNLPNAILFVRR